MSVIVVVSLLEWLLPATADGIDPGAMSGPSGYWCAAKGSADAASLSPSSSSSYTALLDRPRAAMVAPSARLASCVNQRGWHCRSDHSHGQVGCRHRYAFSLSRCVTSLALLQCMNRRNGPATTCTSSFSSCRQRLQQLARWVLAVLATGRTGSTFSCSGFAPRAAARAFTNCHHDTGYLTRFLLEFPAPFWHWAPLMACPTATEQRRAQRPGSAETPAAPRTRG